MQAQSVKRPHLLYELLPRSVIELVQQLHEGANVFLHILTGWWLACLQSQDSMMPCQTATQLGQLLNVYLQVK